MQIYLTQLDMSTARLIRTFKFLNQKIMRNSQEDTANKVTGIAILLSTLKHQKRFNKKQPLKLQIPNDTLKFPLTNRWSNPNSRKSKQEIDMIVKQVKLSFKPAGRDIIEKVNSQHNRSVGSVEYMGFFDTLNAAQIRLARRIYQKFSNVKLDEYNRDREIIFAQSIANGQTCFMMRNFKNNPSYSYQQSRKVQQAYLAQLKRAFETQAPKQQNLKKIGLTYQQLKNKIFNQNQGVYSMLFQDLQRLTRGHILKNTPRMLYGMTQQDRIKQTYYLQAPYPILIKIKNPETQDQQFILAAIGFRYQGNKVRFFSPFFASQEEKIWRLAQEHLGQAIFNDFNLRVHLGFLHFTTHQYNVPMYNLLSKLDTKNQQNYSKFLQYCYSIFNRGLEGVNVVATASLVFPIEQYSLVNKVFNVNQHNSIKYIADFSNNVDVSTFNPIDFMKKNGVTLQRVEKDLQIIRLDLKLFSIISKYVDSLYQIFEVSKVEDKLLQQINEATKQMGVGNQGPRKGLSSKQDVKKLIKNMIFSWVIYHSHTYAGISFTKNWQFRPTALKSPIPYSPQQWKKFNFGDQLPHTKILVQSGKLTQATTQRESTNNLLNILQQLKFRAKFQEQSYRHSKPEQSQKFVKVINAADQALKQLDQFSQELRKVNHRRQNTIQFIWLDPTNMQASLNI